MISIITTNESHTIHTSNFVSADNVISLHITYGKAKSSLLAWTILKMANPINGSMSPFGAVFYHTQQITESAKVLWKGNTI